MSVDVEIAGAEIDDVKSLHFDQPGLTAEHVKDRTFKIAVGPEVAAGTYDVRLVGRFGVSNPRLFAVSRGLADGVEKEPNNDAAQAQAITVNSAVQGMSDGNGEDVFRLTARKGQRITIHCQAQKLDSAMDATLAVTTASGGPIASSSDYFGSDPFIDLLVPADGDYLVSVADLSFRGGFPYRLVVSDKPHAENVFPRAVQAGQSAELTFLGRNFGAAGRPSALKLADLPLEEFTTTVSPPADLLSLGRYVFREHPTDHSVLPTAATATVFGLQVSPAEASDGLNPQTLLVVDGPVAREAEPNDEKEKAQPITLPAVVSGRFDQIRDADWYSFETAAGEGGAYSFNVYSERIAGQADPYLVVVDEAGNRVQELDDFGPRVNAFDGHLRDVSGSVNLGEKKKYRVLVQDRYQRGGPRFQYVLSIRRPRPDFTVAAIHHQNPGPGGTTILQGGAQHLDLVLNPQDGFNGPVTVTAEDLPPGLHAEPTVIAANTRGNFVLWADENAPLFAGPIRLIATGKRGDVELKREVRPYARVWTETSMNSSRPSRQLVVAIRETAPFALSFASDRVEVEAGGKVELPIRLKRLWPDFKDKVTLQPLALPGGFNLPNGEIAGGQPEGKLTLTVQGNMKEGEYTLAVLGQGQVPFSKDPKATSKPNTLVSAPSRPITIVVKPAPKSR